MWDKPRCCGTSELHQCGSKFSECNTGSHANSLPLEGNQQPSLSQQLNLSSRFTLNLHNVSFSQSLPVRRRVIYEKTKHDMGMTWPKAAPKPGPAHSSTGLSKHCHTVSHAGLGVAQPPSRKALGIYVTWAETTQSTAITFSQSLVLQIASETSDGLRLCPQVSEFLNTSAFYSSEKQTSARFRLMWLQPLMTINIHKALCRKDNIFPESWTKLLVIYYILAYNNRIPLCILTEYIIPH